LLSQATIVENPEENRLFFVTDCAINIAPNFAKKKLIIENAVGLASALGYENPKVAAISAIEIANPKIPSTMDAKALQEANERGDIRGCIIAGPLALDNAVSRESARHKDISGPIAGDADILLMPDLAAGNIFTKSLTFYAKMNSAGTILGASCPIIGTSRTDTPSNKYLAILIGLACVGMANA
ncbi:MAG: hypothetical protein LBC41_12560, partial [Clostridiales bacterium]|jgi:phosphate butyryltransferase|nr:hypothetical protein [Clostridiales bacterium]